MWCLRRTLKGNVPHVQAIDQRQHMGCVKKQNVDYWQKRYAYRCIHFTLGWKGDKDLIRTMLLFSFHWSQMFIFEEMMKCPKSKSRTEELLCRVFHGLLGHSLPPDIHRSWLQHNAFLISVETLYNFHFYRGCKLKAYMLALFLFWVWNVQ